MASAPPVIVLGVGRSGTTLLRVMLDRSSELAIPYETFFVPQLAHRHGRRPKIDDFLDDLGRLRTLYDWGITPDDVRPRLREGMTTSETIAAIFETYAERQGKPRWGDKTPLYMQQLPLLERLFPDAIWVHLVRDGRDAALSFPSCPRGSRARRGRCREPSPSSRRGGGRRSSPHGSSAGTPAAATSSSGTRSWSTSRSAVCDSSASTRHCHGRRAARPHAPDDTATCPVTGASPSRRPRASATGAAS